MPRPAPHATVHRRCSAAITHNGPRPAPRLRVCRIDGAGGNPDPSRGGAPDTLVGGRDDPAALQGSVGDAAGRHARSCGDPRSGMRANSRRVRDRRKGRSQTVEYRPGRAVHEGPTPRGRSTERAPSTIHGDIMQNEQRLIRPCRSVDSVTRAWRSCSRSSRIAPPGHLISTGRFREAAHAHRTRRSSTGAVSNSPLLSIRRERGVVQFW